MAGDRGGSDGSTPAYAYAIGKFEHGGWVGGLVLVSPKIRVLGAIALASIQRCLTFVKDISQKLGQIGKVFWVIFKQPFREH